MNQRMLAGGSDFDNSMRFLVMTQVPCRSFVEQSGGESRKELNYEVRLPPRLTQTVKTLLTVR